MTETSPPAIDVTGKRRILLVDDHPVLRQGLAQIINRQSDLAVCWEAENGAEALAMIEHVQRAVQWARDEGSGTPAAR